MPASLGLDIHCHLVPEIDEGSRNLAESVIMARGLESLGVKTVHVTPHQFRFGNDLSNGELRARILHLSEHLHTAGVRLEIVPSAEYMLGERLLDALERGEELLTWPHLVETGASTCALVEIPLNDPVVNVGRLATLFLRRGIQPVMAHPERVRALSLDPRRAVDWRRSGWRFQLDLLSLVSSYGREAQRMAHLYLTDGLYDFVGSDLHRSVQLDALARAHAEFRRLAAPRESVL